MRAPVLRAFPTGAPALVAALLTLAGGALPARADDKSTPASPSNPTATAEAERLVPRLRSDDPAVRDAAAAALVAIGAPALGPLEAEAARAEASAARVRAILAEIGAGSGRAAASSKARAAVGERWYETKFREAAKRVERGDHLAAVKLLDAILVIEPDCPIRDRIQALKVRAKELHIRTSVIEARLVPKRVLVAPGEPIELALEVKNVSNAPLELALPELPEGDVFGALEIETFEANATGERSRTHELQKIQTPIQGSLAIGEVWRTLVALKPQRPLAPGGLRRVTVAGSIRSQVLIKRDEKFDRFLPLFAVEVFVADRSRHAIAAEPRTAIGEAVASLREAKDVAQSRAAAEKLFFAVLLTPANARDAAIADLGATLEKPDDPAAPAAIAALAALADRPLEYDRALWRDWIRKRAN